tara:strand:+ start:1995 stop:2279 length:285 start_codon:yes stop_codon:yes gene_type:complete
MKNVLVLYYTQSGQLLDIAKNIVTDLEISKEGVEIPESSWFINLDKIGNVGAASIYILLDELFHSKKLKKEEKILLSVPESGRFSYTYALLTVC